MELPQFRRLPKHIGVIPDGNRRWAEAQGMGRECGYQAGIDPGFRLYELCLALGIRELTLYGFTVDNTKRPVEQRKEFQNACVEAVRQLSQCDASLLVVGNPASPMFPAELKPYLHRVKFGQGTIRVNFLVNYGWKWDLGYALGEAVGGTNRGEIHTRLASADISRVDLIIRWGGRRRLSGFLPVQSIYADMYVLDELWPDFQDDHFYEALRWYEKQDITLGG